MEARSSISRPASHTIQEYYEEEFIVELYRNVLERLLITLDDEEDDLVESIVVIDESSGLVVHEERLRVWPPWPWPPWGDDDDKPENRTERAHRLAKSIIKFEKAIAAISLDLDVLYQDPITHQSQPVGHAVQRPMSRG